MAETEVKGYGEEQIRRLHEMNRCLNRTVPVKAEGRLRVGVDLGTANVVLAVLDENCEPAAGESRAAHVVRDGIVTDFLGSVRLVREMKETLEERLGRNLTWASCAVPPGVHPGSVRIIGNVLEAAGFEVDQIADEPEAAARALNVTEGAVVDVGGGTTGISILSGGKAVYSADEATGGTHMTLVLAGAMGLCIEEAESLKIRRCGEREVFVPIRPVVEKMATIVKKNLKEHPVDCVFVAGGACAFPDFPRVFEKVLGLPVIIPVEPLLVTPMGIAMFCRPH